MMDQTIRGLTATSTAQSDKAEKHTKIRNNSILYNVFTAYEYFLDCNIRFKNHCHV